jgi:hypothetical protein
MLIPVLISIVLPFKVCCLDNEDSLMKATPSQKFEAKLLPAGEHLLLRTQLNGQKAYFLIDTGASCSVLHTKAAKYFGYDITRNKGKSAGGTAGFGRSTPSPPIVINANLEIGPHKINRAYLAKDLTSIRIFISKQTAFKIVGILGTDMLKILQAKLDLRHRVLTY